MRRLIIIIIIIPNNQKVCPGSRCCLCPPRWLRFYGFWSKTSHGYIKSKMVSGPRVQRISPALQVKLSGKLHIWGSICEDGLEFSSQILKHDPLDLGDKNALTVLVLGLYITLWYLKTFQNRACDLWDHCLRIWWQVWLSFHPVIPSQSKGNAYTQNTAKWCFRPN